MDALRASLSAGEEKASKDEELASAALAELQGRRGTILLICFRSVEAEGSCKEA